MGTNIDSLLGVQPVDTTPSSHKRVSAIDALLLPEEPEVALEDQPDFKEFKKTLEAERKQTLFPEFVKQEYLKKHGASPFEAPSDSPLPEINFWSKVDELKDNPGQLVPFLSGGQDAVKFGKLLMAANRYSKGEEIEDDIKLLQEYQQESERERTFGYQVLNTISYSIPFALELGFTGGIAGLGRIAIMKGGKKALKEILTKKGKETFLKKASKFAITRTIQTPIAGATHIWAGQQQKQLDSTLNQIETGEEKESAIYSLTKAFGEQWVETLSEFSGGLLKPASKYVGNNLLKLSLFSAFKKANPSVPMKVLKQIFEKTGYNGVIGEMFEERVGTIGHRTMTALGLGDQKPPIIPSAEQLAVEFVAFSIPGIGLAAASKLFEKAEKIGPEGMKIEEEEPEVIDFSVPEKPVVAPDDVKPEVIPEVAPEEIRATEAGTMVFHGSADGKLKVDERGNINIGVNREDVEKFGPVVDISRNDLNIKEISTKEELFDIGDSQEMKDELIKQGFDTITAEDQGLIIDPQGVSERLNLPIAKGIQDLTVDELAKKQVEKKEEVKKTTFKLTPEQEKSIDRGDEIPDLLEVEGSQDKPSPRPTLIGEGDLKDFKKGQTIHYNGDDYELIDAIKGRELLYKTEFKLKDKKENIKTISGFHHEAVVEIVSEPTKKAVVKEAVKDKPKAKKEKPVVFDGSKESDDFVQKKVDEGKIKIEGMKPTGEATGEIPQSLMPKTIAWKGIIGNEPAKTPDSWGNAFFQIRAEMPPQVIRLNLEFKEVEKSLESLVSEGKLVPVEFVETATAYKKELVGIKGEGIDKFYIDLAYLKPIAKLLPNAKAFTVGEKKPIVFKENDKIVALIMPMTDIDKVDEISPLQPSDKTGIIESDEKQQPITTEEVEGVGSGFGELSGSVPVGVEESGGVEGVNRGNDAEARVLESGRGDDVTGERYEPSDELNERITTLIEERGDNPGAYTEEEKEMIAQYSGAGGREKEGAEGRGLLDEYYTPSDVAKLTWQSVSKFIDFNNKEDLTILEPSAGIGSFFTYAPEAVGEFGILDAYELNDVSSKILHILHPGVTVKNTSFERMFVDERGNQNPNLKSMIEKGVYDVVIGNPPYGSHRGVYKGLGEEPNIARYEEYFLKRALDLTKEEGVVAFVMPSRFLRTGNSKAKEEIVKMALLVEAYRLPNKAFGTTDIGTDIVVFRKHKIDEKLGAGLNKISNDSYFESFPKNILGTPTTRRGRFGEEPAVEGDLSQLKDLVIQGEIETVRKETEPSKKIGGERYEPTGKKVSKEILAKAKPKKIAVDKKVTIVSTKKGKLQSVTPDIDATLTKEEIELWKKVQPTGELDIDIAPDTISPTTNFYKGKWYNEFNYLQGNIYEKLEQLKIDKNQMADEQYNTQKRKLESIKPANQSIDKIALSPQDTLLEKVKFGDQTLKERFLEFIRELPYDALGSSSRYEVREYVNNQSVTGISKEMNAAVRVRRREVGNRLFNKFLQESITDEEKKIVEDYYNANRNAIHIPDYGNVPISVKISDTLRGSPLKLRDVQKTGAGFLVNKGVGGLAHEVGGGKTITSIVAVQEMMAKGWAKKPLFIVEKNNYAKWIEEISEVVPGATINQLANLGAEFKGDFTTFEIPEGSFSVMKVEGLRKLGFKDETYEKITGKLQDIISGINTSKRGKAKEKEGIQEISGKAKRGVSQERFFEDLGFDLLILDEAHIYKNLFTGARIEKGQGNEYSRVRGGTSSNRAIKIFFATQYILEKNNDRNVFLLTATPFTNNPMEYYSMLSYMAKRRLESIGLKNVNQFMTAFMDLTTTFKVTHTQQVISSDVIERFRNANQLRKLLHEFFDFKTGDELGVERPNKVSKQFFVNPTLEQIDLFKSAEKLLELDAGALQYINELLNITISPFLSRFNTRPVPLDSKEIIDDSPKIKMIMELVKESKKLNPSGGIIIHAARGLTLHKPMKEYLINYIGYKPEEVEIISGAVKRGEQAELGVRAKFNSGDIKVIIVSDVVQRGVDLQGNTTHLFRLSMPYRPDEITQIEGRAWRHGNKWINFMSGLVMMNDSIDPFLNQLLETKNKRTQEAQKKDDSTIEAGGDVNFEELKLLLITNPKKKLEAEKTFNMASEKKKLDELNADLGFISTKYKSYQEARDEVQSRKNDLKDEEERLKDERKEETPDEEYIEIVKKDIDKGKQSVVRAEKALQEVLTKLERAGDFEQVQERINTIESKIKNQEVKIEKIESDIDEKIEEAPDVDTRIGVKDQDYGTQLEEFREASKGFFKIRQKPKPVRAPSGTATALSAPIGRYDDIGNKIREYESDEEAKDQGLKPYQNFKLFEKVKELIQKYAKTIGQGYTPRGALGVFYTETENIRSPLNDLSVASHEITHFLDKTYQIANKVMGIKGYAINGNPIYESGSYKTRQQMTDLYERYYPGGKRKHKLKKRMTEGFATLLQKYAQSPQTISVEFPNLVREFLKPNGKYYHTVIGEIIVDLKGIISEYQGLSELDKIGARVVDESVNINKSDWLNTNDKIFEEIADNIYPIEKLAKITGIHFKKSDPSLALRQYNNINQLITNNTNGKRGYWGWRNLNFVKLHDFNWRTLFDMLIDQKNTREFNSFLVARNEYFLYQELEQLQNIDNPEKEERLRIHNLETILRNDGFTKDEVAGAYEKNKERFVEEVKIFDQLIKEDLSFLNDGSVQLLEKEQYDRLVSKEGYASMKREFYDEIVGEEAMPASLRVGKVHISSLIQRKGSQRPIISPLYSAIANHSEITKKGMKQITYNSLGDIADKAPTLFQTLQLQAVPDKQGRMIFPQEKDPNIIMTRKNYKRVPILADATIKRVYDEVLTPRNINFLKILFTGASRFFTKGTTGLFPAFAITNMVRDQLTAVGLTRNKFVPLYDPLHKIIKAIAKSDTPYHNWLMEYLVMGGERMTLVGWQDLSPHELAIKIRGELSGLEKVVEGLNSGMDVLALPSKWSEIMTRAAEYIKARESGKPSIVAIEEAGRVSIPFHHIGRLGGGDLGKTFVKSIPFFNPGIQVLAQTYRSLDTIKSRKRMLFVFLAMTAAEVAAFGLLASGGDDEQKQLYKDLEGEELANGIYIPNPAGKTLIRFPVPNMFSFLGAMINMAILEGTNEASYKVGDYIAAGTSYFPQQFNLLEWEEAYYSWFPQIMKPLALSIANIQDWPKIRPLESQSQESKTKGLRYHKGTSPLAKWIGRKFNISPIKTDYLLTGYFGRATGFITGKPGIYNPIRGVNREYYFQSGRTLQNFYDLKEKNEQQYHDYKNRLIQYPQEKVREIKRIRDRTKAINKMLGNYRDIDIDEQPERATNLRDRIIELIDELNKTL